LLLSGIGRLLLRFKFFNSRTSFFSCIRSVPPSLLFRPAERRPTLSSFNSPFVSGEPLDQLNFLWVFSISPFSPLRKERTLGFLCLICRPPPLLYECLSFSLHRTCRNPSLLFLRDLISPSSTAFFLLLPPQISLLPCFFLDCRNIADGHFLLA